LLREIRLQVDRAAGFEAPAVCEGADVHRVVAEGVQQLGDLGLGGGVVAGDGQGAAVRGAGGPGQGEQAGREEVVSSSCHRSISVSAGWWPVPRRHVAGSSSSVPASPRTAARSRPGSCGSGDDRSCCRGRSESPAHQAGITISSSFPGQLLVVRRLLRGEHAAAARAIRSGSVTRSASAVTRARPPDRPHPASPRPPSWTSSRPGPIPDRAGRRGA
jgi:hypothetical protein